MFNVKEVAVFIRRGGSLVILHPEKKGKNEKDMKNLRKNGRMKVKFYKWLVHIPFLCYLTILLNLAEGAEYGGC